MAARSSYQDQLARTVFDTKTVATLMKTDPVKVNPDMSLFEFANDIMLHHNVSFVPVVEDGVLLGHMDQALFSSIDRENWVNTRVADVFSGLDDTSIVSPELPVQDLMTIISKTGRRKFLVVERHKLVGVITLADLVHYLELSAILDQDKA